MVGGGKLEGTEDERGGIRLMLVRAHGCRICVALDAVEGIFDVGAGAAAATSATLANGSTVPLVDWGDVTGVGAGAEADGIRGDIPKRPGLTLRPFRIGSLSGFRWLRDLALRRGSGACSGRGRDRWLGRGLRLALGAAL